VVIDLIGALDRPFPVNLLAWVTITASTFAVICFIGAAFDAIVAFRMWRERRSWDRNFRDRLNMDVRKGRGHAGDTPHTPTKGHDK